MNTQIPLPPAGTHLRYFIEARNSFGKWHILGNKDGMTLRTAQRVMYHCKQELFYATRIAGYDAQGRKVVLP